MRVSVQLRGQTDRVMSILLTGTADVATTAGSVPPSMTSGRDGASAAAREGPPIEIGQAPTAAALAVDTSHRAARTRSVHERAWRSDARRRATAADPAFLVIATSARRCYRQTRQ